MLISTKPIVATTALSFLIHGVVVVAVLLVQAPIAPSVQGVGEGLDVHLVSSIAVSDNKETSSAMQSKVLHASVLAEHGENHIDEKKSKALHQTVVSLSDKQAQVRVKITQNLAAEKHDAIFSQRHNVGNANAITMQATNASHQQHSIVEMLHRRISDKKEYPYLAKRQRREGIATVEFVLHPDGKIEDAHLIKSSRTLALDRAALQAVKRIEPFSVAQDYLDQSERFQIDVAFTLL
ncbi:MAG: hypothetical protein COB77_04110 [Gammaproteobacteria bacterium]|nr:MAG: hypothetical protein COB77_04110 [Gammaproteobacteria bacterium]